MGVFGGPRGCCRRQKQGQGHRSRAHRGGFGGRPRPSPPPLPWRFRRPEELLSEARARARAPVQGPQKWFWGSPTAPPPLPGDQGGGGSTRREPRASAHSGSGNSTRGVGPRVCTHSGSGSYNGTAPLGGHDVEMSSRPSWEPTVHPYPPLSVPAPHPPPHLSSNAAPQVPARNGTALHGSHDVGVSDHPSWEPTVHPYPPISFPAPHPPPHLSSSAAPQVPAHNGTALHGSHDAGVHPTSPTSHPSWQPTAYPYPDVRPQSEHRPLPHGASDTSKGTVT